MNNKPLPDLIVKKVKIEDLKFGGDVTTVSNDWPDKYEPFIISTPTFSNPLKNRFIMSMQRENEFPKLRWIDVQKTFESKFNLKCFYARMAKREGNLIVNKFDLTPELTAKIQSTSFAVDGEELQVFETTGDYLTTFF